MASYDSVVYTLNIVVNFKLFVYLELFYIC